MANTHSLDLELDSIQYAKIAHGDQTGLGMTSDFSIECWVKLESQPALNSNFYFVSKFYVGNNYNYLFSYRKTGETPDEYKLRIHVCIGVGVIGLALSAAQTLTTGTWFHIAVGVDESANQAEFFVNGSSIGTANFDYSITGNMLDEGPDFSIGADMSGNSPTDGLIDDVRVWNVLKTEAQIATSMSEELIGNETNLQGYWKLNNDYTDETSNSNDLTAINSPVFSTDIPFSNLTINVSDSLSLSENLEIGNDITPNVSDSLSLSDVPTVSPPESVMEIKMQNIERQGVKIFS